MRDDLELDDPVWQQLRAARPAAPSSLERDVLARLAVSRRMPIVVGCAVAIAAIVCLVIVLRDGGRADTAGDAPPAAIVGPEDAPRAPAPPDAAPAPGWAEVDAMWAAIEAAHRSTVAACGGSGPIAVHAERRRDGSAAASHPLPGLGIRGPTPVERCRVRAVAAIALPPMPPDLIAVDFELSLAPEARSAPDWRDPMGAVARAFAAAEVGACAAKLTAVVDRTASENPRVWLPRFQFSGADAARTSGCVARGLAGRPLPPLPPFLRSITLHYRGAR